MDQKTTNYFNAINLIKSRGVTIEEIASITYDLQKKYYPDLTMDECVHNVEKVIEKREVQNAIFTGISLDILAEENKLPEPLQTIVREDNPLYGIDEIIAVGIVNVFGTIGLTNFGYVDKAKTGVIKRLDEEGKNNKCHTFLDDIVGGIASGAASRIAHNRG